MQADAVHSFHAQHGVVIAAPYGHRSILRLLDLGFDRHESCRPVVLWPVEFHSAGDPWAGKSDQRRLDHILAVKEIVPCRLVVTDMNPSANLRQDHEPEILILNV